MCMNLRIRKNVTVYSKKLITYMWYRHEANRSVQTSERLRDAWMFLEVVVAAASTIVVF